VSNFYDEWLKFLTEGQIEKTRDTLETSFFLDAESLKDLNQYSAVAESTDYEWEIPSSTDSKEVRQKNAQGQLVKFNQLKKNKKPLDKRVADLTISDYEERGWVLTVPNEVLDNIENIVQTTKEASEIFTTGIYKDAKEWYFILNKLSTYGVGVPEEEKDEGLFAMLLAVFSPMTPFQINYREALLAYKAIKIDITNNYAEELMEYVSLGSMKGNKEAILFREEFPDLAVAQYWAEISLFAGAKWNNFCIVVQTYLQNNGMTLSETSKLLQSDLDWIRSKKIRKLGLLAKQRHFVGKTKVANFSLNIIDPTIGLRDTDYLLNVTIDTWMTRAYYPGIEISSEIMNDPYSYYYIVGHVVKKAKEYNMLPHEMQAIIWVHLLKMNKKNVSATASEMTNLFSGLVKDEINNMYALSSSPQSGFEALLRASKTLLSRTQTKEDFQNIRSIIGLPADRGELTEGFKQKFRHFSIFNS
jgi:hypothetical protein